MMDCLLTSGVNNFSHVEFPGVRADDLKMVIQVFTAKKNVITDNLCYTFYCLPFTYYFIESLNI